MNEPDRTNDDTIPEPQEGGRRRYRVKTGFGIARDTEEFTRIADTFRRIMTSDGRIVDPEIGIDVEDRHIDVGFEITAESVPDAYASGAKIIMDAVKRATAMPDDTGIGGRSVNIGEASHG